ncbi:il-1 receptor antagonist [Raccoonpox virus]|uniref:IL-1 receptor antagonist n=1 Tax=Raccoon poxvirus TaxID=10256 RepID=A0A0G3FZW3_RACVI|nr:IL-1 receptor antagonist [Raccoonpox virus]AKJ93654.1 IL-1 receptor antagonist [Raccoonpox virus]AOP31285.1 il-1 receptor antagonist [Raccoonpox virus]
MGTVKIFNRGEFDDIRNDLVDLSKFIKWSTINSNISIYSTETIDISQSISEILYKKFKNVQNIEVSSGITFIKYNSLDTDNYELNLSDNDMEYYLVICLDKSTIKTTICPTSDTTVTSSDDIMFSKTLDFRFSNLKRGYKIVVCSISITYKPSICKIQYNGNYIDISTDQEGNNLCYCNVSMYPHHLIDLETMGVLVDRSGRCLLVDEFYYRFRKNKIYDSFIDLCMDHIFELSTDELFTMRNEDGKNIAWDTNKLDTNCKTWIPRSEDDYEFLYKLMNLKSKDHKFEYYVLVGDTDPCTIFTFKVTKYYLNIDT